MRQTEESKGAGNGSAPDSLVEYKYSSRNLTATAVLLLVVAVVIVFMAALALNGECQPRRYSPFYTLFIAFLGVLVAIRMLSRTGEAAPALIIDSEGLRYPSRFPNKLLWTDVRDLWVMRDKRAVTLRLRLFPDAARNLRRLDVEDMLLTSSWLDKETLDIACWELDASPDEIAAQIARYVDFEKLLRAPAPENAPKIEAAPDQKFSQQPVVSPEAQKRAIARVDPERVRRARERLEAVVEQERVDAERTKPLVRFPWGATFLCILLIAVYLREEGFLLLVHDADRPVPLHDALVALGGVTKGGVYKDGEWWRLATASLLHTEGTYVFFAVTGAVLWGFLFEKLVGPGWFLGIFAASALAGSAAALSSSRAVEVAIGPTSGMIGLAAAFTVAVFRYPRFSDIFGLLAMQTFGLLALLGPVSRDATVVAPARLAAIATGVIAGSILLRYWPTSASDRPSRLMGAFAAGFFLVACAPLAFRSIHVVQPPPKPVETQPVATKPYKGTWVPAPEIPNYCWPKEWADQDYNRDKTDIRDASSARPTDYPRDPRVQLVAAAKARFSRRPADEEAALRRALQSPDTLSYMGLEAHVRLRLADLFQSLGRDDDARREIAPVCDKPLKGWDAWLRYELDLCPTREKTPPSKPWAAAQKSPRKLSSADRFEMAAPKMLNWQERHAKGAPDFPKDWRDAPAFAAANIDKYPWDLRLRWAYTIYLAEQGRVEEEAAALRDLNMEDSYDLWNERDIVLADLLQSEGRVAEAKELASYYCGDRRKYLTEHKRRYVDQLGLCSQCMPWTPPKSR